jgi:hypothetical protein
MISTSLFKAFQQRGVLAAAQSAPMRFFSKDNKGGDKAPT